MARRYQVFLALPVTELTKMDFELCIKILTERLQDRDLSKEKTKEIQGVRNRMKTRLYRIPPL